MTTEPKSPWISRPLMKAFISGYIEEAQKQLNDEEYTGIREHNEGSIKACRCILKYMETLK